MDNATSIKGLIQGMTGGEVQIYQGTVTSTSPLTIQIVNDSSLQITEANTYVPEHLKDYTTTVSISGGSVSGSTSASGEHTHSLDITIGEGGDPEHTHPATGEAAEAGSHSHSFSGLSISDATMTVHAALKVGDTVHVLSLFNGKQYFVLGRA